MKKLKRNKEEIAEDLCFICKDGGSLRVCDYKNCLKSYHALCVEKDPSFLESNERWTCSWHSCFLCHKSSTFQCFCCPNSLCRACIRGAEFVQVKKKTKGFCNNCLKLAKLIEENVDVDSDGEKVDFKDTETYEFLFKDYWEIVKDQECLTLVDLQAADAFLKRGGNFKSGSDSDINPEESMSEDNDMENKCDEAMLFCEEFKENRARKKKTLKRSKSRKKNFIGWGSEELIQFLISISMDPEEPLTQSDTCKIIKDYVQSNNLMDPIKKKKTVLCDEKLHSLFKRKSVKLNKISKLLESHFAANADCDEESSSEDGDESMVSKRQRRTASDPRTPKSEPNNFREKVSEPFKSCYASIIDKNIKPIYLKRSLILELLKKDPETFENKVTWCFVRVKLDPKDFYYSPQKIYLLGQVTGIKKAPETYKIGETSSDIILCISNIIWKDIRISMLSDDDFEEEECEDLRQLVKKGLFKRPTVAELDRKIRSVHEDIMNHWINREIVKLQKQIDQANEKGWRRELFEYIERRELLRTPAERLRLLEEIPKVIADVVEEIPVKASTLNPHMENEGDCVEATVKEAKGGHAACVEAISKETEGNGPASVENVVEGKTEAGGHAAYLEAITKEYEGNGPASLENAVEGKTEGGHAACAAAITKEAEGNGPASLENDVEGKTEGTASHEKIDEIKGDGSATNTNGLQKLRVGLSGTVATSHEKADETKGTVATSHEKIDEIKGDGSVTNTNGLQKLHVGLSGTVATSPEKVDKTKGNEAASIEKVAEEVLGGIGAAFTGQKQLDMEREQHKSIEMKESSSVTQVIEIEGDEEDPRDKRTSEIQIIDLDDYEEDLSNALKEIDSSPTDTCEILGAAVRDTHKVWHYLDPSGREHGPFAMTALRYWKEEEGFFDDDFKVWRASQSRKDAILLTDALRQFLDY